jgi:MFS family permease
MAGIMDTASSRATSHEDALSTRHIEPMDIADDAQEFELTGLNLITVMSGLILAIFLVSLDSAIVATAVPYVTAEFKSAGDTAWYGSAYTLATCALQPIAGKLYAKFPIKVCFGIDISRRFLITWFRQCFSSSWLCSRLDPWSVLPLRTLPD